MIAAGQGSPSLERPGEGSAQQLFAARAIIRPDAIAVSGPDATLTYGDDDAARLLAEPLPVPPPISGGEHQAGSR